MPTDKRRWQPCSFGTQSQANRVAIAGCHASGGWTRDRTYHTQASRLKLAKVRLEDIEGDLSQGVRQLYRAGKDAFAERVMALMLPQNCVEADKCCYACFRTHFLDQLTPGHRAFTVLEPPVTQTGADTSSQIDGAAKRGAAAASEGESRTAKRLRSSSSAAQEAQEAAQLAAVHAWLQRVEVSESRAACFGGGAPNEMLRAAVVLRRHLEEGTAGTASEEDAVSIVAELRAQVALLQQARRDVAKNVTGKQKKALKEARKESEAWEAQASKLRGALQAEQAGRADAS